MNPSSPEIRLRKSRADHTEFEGSSAWQTGAAVEAPLWAQPLDPSLPSTWGETTLDAGFVPDPFSTSYMAAASEPLGADDGTPLRHVNAAPSYVVNYGGGDTLRFYATADLDTTLIVRTPTGELLYNDDANGVDPAVTASPAPAGAYQVWSGVHEGPRVPANVTLLVTELP